jgi:hypothetical protein
LNSWTDWEVVRHQVAIAGRVVDNSEQPVAGAQVMITAMPRALRQKVNDAASAAGAAGKPGDERYDRTFTTTDGLYYFLDLPAGRYTLQGLDRRSGAQDEKTVSVSWSRDGSVKRARADLKLSKA